MKVCAIKGCPRLISWGDSLCSYHRMNKKRCLIYFIECGDFIKIGHTRRLEERINEVTLLTTTRGSQTEERRLHALFADARHKGEWFKKSNELVAYIKALQCT